MQFYKTDDTMVQALKAGELDYARDPNADQLKALEGQPNIKTVVGASNGWTQLAFNEYGATKGQTLSAGVGPSTQALWDPAFRDALGYAIDKPTLVNRVLGGYGDVGTTIVPPVLGAVARGARPPTDLRHRAREAEAGRGGLQARRERQPPGQAGQADQPAAGLPGHGRHLREVGPVREGLVRPARDQGDRPAVRLGDPRQHRPPARGRQRLQGQLRHRAVGLGRATRTRTPCCRSSGATRSAPRRTASTAIRPTTSCTTSRTPRRRPTRARRSWPRCRT